MSAGFIHHSALLMDQIGSLHQLTSAYPATKAGVPELIKNSKDAYFFLGVEDRPLRQIVVIADERTTRLGVIDFAGASHDRFQEWAVWSSRTASQHESSEHIEGGKGNGGKSFMVRGCTAFSYFESCFGGRRTRMGFTHADPDLIYTPGTWQDGAVAIEDIAAPNPRQHLDRVLSDLGCKYDALPEPARRAFEARGSFSCVLLSGVSDWMGLRKSAVRRLIKRIPDALRNHSQAAGTLDTCDVWVMAASELLVDEPLSQEFPEPLPSLPAIDPIPVPDKLLDPETRQMVSTGPGEPTTRFLQFYTSRDRLHSTTRQHLNVVRVSNGRNSLANLSLTTLCTSLGATFLRGYLQVPGLKSEDASGSDREHLVDKPLTRALKHFVGEQAFPIAERIEQTRSSSEDHEEISRANEDLVRMRNLMRRFLDGGDGSIEGGPGPDPDSPTPGTSMVSLQKIILEHGQDRVCLATGSTVPIIWECVGTDKDGKERNTRYPGVTIMVDDPSVLHQIRSNLFRGVSPGSTRMRAVAQGTEVVSNEVTVEVVDCAYVEVTPVREVIKQGGHTDIKCQFLLSDGSLSDNLLIEASVDPNHRGTVNRNGRFFALSSPGEATVRVRFGSGNSDVGQIAVQVSDEQADRSHGGPSVDVPRILMCGTDAPGLEDQPKELRTHPGGEDFPTVIDFEPQFINVGVVFLNPGSPESKIVRQRHNKQGSLVSVTSATYRDFLRLKVYDILCNLKARQLSESEDFTYMQWRRLRSDAETKCAEFLLLARELMEPEGANGAQEE